MPPIQPDQPTDAPERPPAEGIFRLLVWRRGVLVADEEQHNLVVTAARETHARLLGGDTAGRSVTRFGVGSGGTAPAAGNTGLTDAFVRPLVAATYPAAGRVQFQFALTSGEANGLSIREFGLFTAAGTLYARRVRAGALVKDSEIALAGTWTIEFP